MQTSNNANTAIRVFRADHPRKIHPLFAGDDLEQDGRAVSDVQARVRAA
jgi:hypothetical protein